VDAASLARLLALGAIWGGSFLFMRVAAPAIGALPTTFGRVAFAAAGLGALVLALRLPFDFRGRLRAALALGLLNSAVPFMLFAHAAKVLPAGYSAILNSTVPPMAVVIGAAFFGERTTPAKVAGVLLGLAGVFVLTQRGPVELTAPVVLGIAACLGAAACYATAGFLARRWVMHRGVDDRLLALGSLLGATVALAPLFLWQWAGPGIDWGHASPAVWLSIASLGLVCSALAFVLYFKLLADVGPMKTMTVAFLLPVFGVFWGWLLLDELLSLAHLKGGALIALSLWLVLRPGTARPA
jgi:drug/metabolite transporter (DMT)-like permease